MKLIYWLTLLLVFTFFLFQRRIELWKRPTSQLDLYVFFIWTALLFFPLIREISFGGFSFKRDFDEFRTSVNEKILNLRTDIQNAINIQNQFSQNIIFPTYKPSKEDQLPVLEQNMEELKAEFTVKQPLPSEDGSIQDDEQIDEMHIDDDIQFLINARHLIELKIRQIWNNYYGDFERPQSFGYINKEMVRNELISPKTFSLIREVYAIGSQALHEGEASISQIKFVRETTPELLKMLSSL